MEEVECIVIGAGVVGLACGAAIARSGREVLVLEAESAIGLHASSRNSEVIHAGIYYPQGSLKAKLCRRGKEQLYAYAKDRKLPHKRLGKLIVATCADQIDQLEEIRARAAANGVTDLRMLDRAEAQEMEPAVECHAALHSPSTGIIDSHALMLSLQADLEEAGGMVVLRTPITGCSGEGGGFIVETAGEESLRLRARQVVNCAGMMAPQVARQFAGLDASTIPEPHFSIGHYYRLAGPSPCKRLVYPVPEQGGLGIHLTLDLGGQARFGPDVRWIDEIDYRFDDSRADEFVAAIRTYLPGIDRENLSADYTGIRPKIVGPGQPAADFRIDSQKVHGVAGLVNLFGIESPGLTSSLAIADYVAGLLPCRSALPPSSH